MELVKLAALVMSAAVFTVLSAVAAQTETGSAHFVDITDEAGIGFVHNSGAEGRRYLPETMGAGLAFFDYDNDGFLDLYLINSGPMPGFSQAPPVYNALYRNLADGTFVEVTESSRLGDSGFGMGVAVGDNDNDGDLDLYVTNFGANAYYRNGGLAAGWRFAEWTEQIGLTQDGWGTSATFLDGDNDGDLDLYLTNYLDYPTENVPKCQTPEKRIEYYCSPVRFEGQADHYFVNLGEAGDWRFADRTVEVGMGAGVGRGLGVVAGDIDLDGDTDLYIANDTMANFLWRNQGGHFVEEGLVSGTALNEMGSTEAGMGVDMADIDGDCLPDLFVTNFQWESNTFYRNRGQGIFSDATKHFRLHKPSFAFLGFGTGFLDFDHDGDLDLFAANGHVWDNTDQLVNAHLYAHLNQLFANSGDGHFEELQQAGPGLDLVYVTRGSAFGDYDNDGDVDIALNNSNQRANLLRNEGNYANHWLGLVFEGRSSNRDGLGTQVKLFSRGQVQCREVRRNTSYLAANDPRLVFGLGLAAAVERIEIRWPSGGVQVLEGMRADQYLRVREQ